jgi:hypothetical protein
LPILLEDNARREPPWAVEDCGPVGSVHSLASGMSSSSIPS